MALMMKVFQKCHLAGDSAIQDFLIFVAFGEASSHFVDVDDSHFYTDV